MGRSVGTTKRAPSRVRSYRIGTLRRRHAPARAPIPGSLEWPGDVNEDRGYEQAVLPVWINGQTRAALQREMALRVLAFAQGALFVLALSYLLMKLAT